MKEALLPSYGWSFLCPECRTWNSYHSPLSTPTRVVLEEHAASFVFVCDTCGEECSAIITAPSGEVSA